MFATPQKEHQWLDQLVGEWTYENESVMGPDQPPMKFTGTDSVRSLGGLWAICEGRGDMPGGGTGYMIMTIGYDPATKRYVGSFIGSMMTHMWIYDGELDAAGKVLTLNAEGPSFSPEGGMANYQDIIEIVSPDHRILRSQFQNADGSWTQFMTAHYRRAK
jgi:hypothetical protein